MPNGTLLCLQLTPGRDTLMSRDLDRTDGQKRLGIRSSVHLDRRTDCLFICPSVHLFSWRMVMYIARASQLFDTPSLCSIYQLPFDSWLTLNCDLRFVLQTFSLQNHLSNPSNSLRTVGTGYRNNWKVVELTGRLWEYHGRSWKVMETGRVFGLCDHLSACMTWRCLETSRNVSFQHVSAQCLMYIRAHMALSWKINANYLVYSNKNQLRLVVSLPWEVNP